MRHHLKIVSALLLLASSGSHAQAPAAKKAATPGAPMPTLNEARRGFVTKLAGTPPAPEPAPKPPAAVFQLIKYDAPAGKLAAYITPDPRDGKKHPAIVWITGGDCNTINELWKPAPRKNDQTAAAYRKAGIVLMFPSLRGGNDNPGRREGFLGEVDDILAATDYLARQPYVDPKRIYLGGHSTGGTMVMLVAESTDRYRAVFSFGPAASTRNYPEEFTPFDRSNMNEHILRSPIVWLHSVRCPLFVFEGTEGGSNIESMRAMAKVSKNPLNHFLTVKGTDHFSILAPVNEIIAARILRDQGPATNLTFSEDELGRSAGR